MGPWGYMGVLKDDGQYYYCYFYYSHAINDGRVRNVTSVAQKPSEAFFKLVSTVGVPFNTSFIPVNL